MASGCWSMRCSANEPEVPARFIQQMRATDPEMFALELEGLASWGGVGLIAARWAGSQRSDQGGR